MRRAEKEITDRSEIDAFLRSQTVCHLAMVDGPDPYVVPLTYGYDGESIYFHSAKEGRKIDVLRRNPRVCFEISGDLVIGPPETVCRKTTRYRSVIGTGTARLIEDREEKLRGLGVLMGQQYGPGVWDLVPEQVDRLLIIRVDIATISGKWSGRSYR